MSNDTIIFAKDRDQWFRNMVGKVIYRSITTCKCVVCAEVYKNGLLVLDQYHADYLYDVEGMYHFDGYPFQYFETIKERDEFESKQITKQIN